jgi:hypothetical protein
MSSLSSNPSTEKQEKKKNLLGRLGKLRQEDHKFPVGYIINLRPSLAI